MTLLEERINQHRWVYHNPAHLNPLLGELYDALLSAIHRGAPLDAQVSINTNDILIVWNEDD